jgi:hypothetical protein
MRIESHTDVIAAFGGQASLARSLGEEPARACHWNERGIPAKHWHEVEELAREAGLPVTARVLKGLPRGRKTGVVRHNRAA